MLRWRSASGVAALEIDPIFPCVAEQGDQPRWSLILYVLVDATTLLPNCGVMFDGLKRLVSISIRPLIVELEESENVLCVEAYGH
jgi:hypothetical protein